MKPEFWHQKWKVGDINFHQSEFHPWLVKHFQTISNQKVLVPLCGKSKDMLFLLNQGNQVVGVELSLMACEAFFSENKIPVKKKTVGGFTVFESDSITLWSGSFFELPEEVIDQATMVYDRAAFYALPKEMRKDYAERFNRRALKGNFSMFLLSVVYDQSKVEGPAFSVDEKEITDRYGKNFKIQKVESNPTFNMKSEKFKGVQVSEEAYWLKA